MKVSPTKNMRLPHTKTDSIDEKGYQVLLSPKRDMDALLDQAQLVRVAGD